MSLLEDRILARQFQERKEYFTKKLIADSMTIKQYNVTLSDDDTAFLQQELTATEAEIIEHKPTDTNHRKLWKVVNLGAGLKSIDYHELMRSGKSKYTSYGETDVPLATAKRNSVPNPVRQTEIKYSFQQQDIAYMQRSGFNLDMEDAKAAKEGNEYTLNSTAFFGNKPVGLKGYFSYATDNKLAVITPVAGAGVSADNTWTTKTAEEILEDCTKLKRAGREETKGQVDYNVLAVGIKAYGELESKCFTVGGQMTSESVLDRLLKKRMFERVEMCSELDKTRNDIYDTLAKDSKEVNTLLNNKNVAIAFSDRTDVFKKHTPLELTSIPIQVVGLTYTVHMYSDDAGLFMYRKYGGAYLLDV